MKTINEVNDYLRNRADGLVKDLEIYRNALFTASGEGDSKAIREARDNVTACMARISEVQFLFSAINHEAKEPEVKPPETPEA